MWLAKAVSKEKDFEDIIDNPIDVEYMKTISPNKIWTSAHPDPSSTDIRFFYDEGPKCQPSESLAMHYAIISKSASNGVNIDGSPTTDQIIRNNGNILNMDMAHTPARTCSHSRSVHSA